MVFEGKLSGKMLGGHHDRARRDFMAMDTGESPPIPWKRKTDPKWGKPVQLFKRQEI